MKETIGRGRRRFDLFYRTVEDRAYIHTRKVLTLDVWLRISETVRAGHVARNNGRLLTNKDTLQL